MTNKMNYDVTFQYDFDEENPKKFSDGRVKRAMAAHDGVFLDDCNDYGIKDLNFNIVTTQETLKTIVESVLKDADRCDVRMSVLAKRKSDLIVLNTSTIEDKTALFDDLNKHKELIGFKKIEPSKNNKNLLTVELFQHIDKNLALKKVEHFAHIHNVTEVFLDVDIVEAINSNNYKLRKKTSLDNN